MQFTKAINPLTVTPATFQMFPYYTNVPVTGIFATSSDGKTVTFTPSTPLNSLTFYALQLTSGITDMEGQNLSGNAAITFTTGEGASALAAVIATVNPAPNGSVGSTININGSYFGTSQGASRSQCTAVGSLGILVRFQEPPTAIQMGNLAYSEPFATCCQRTLARNLYSTPLLPSMRHERNTS